MADRQGAGYKTVQQNGEYGNACRAIFEDAFAADADGTVLQLGQLAGSIVITRVVTITGDMGGAQTMDVGYRYLTAADGTSDPDAFEDGIDTGTAAAVNTYDGVTRIAAGHGIEIVASNIGAAATGSIKVIVDYVYLGQ